MMRKSGDIESTTVSSVTLENLTRAIKEITRYQAEELHMKDRKRTNLKVWNLALDTAKLALLMPNFFKDLSETGVKQELNTLQQTVESLISEGVLVKKHGTGQLVPIPYEVLELIFSQTTETFRLKHFHELLNFYYKTLKSRLNDTFENIYSEKLKFDMEVKTLLPIIKVEIVQEMLKQCQPDRVNQLNDLGNNLKNFFSSPRLNQEDIYEIIKNKFNATEFSLQNYQLIQLNQQNGQLGEYFQLKIEIKFPLENKTTSLFAKFLTPKADYFIEMLKLGPSMKEDWFYLGFLPKLRDIGLSELLDYAPNCYFSRVDDVLILDDLSKLGFVSLTPNIKLEYSTLKLAVCQLAKFHACSFILEEVLSQKEGKDVRLDDIYGEYLKEAAFVRDATFVKDTEGIMKTYLMYFLSTFPGMKGNHSDEELKEKINKCYNTTFEKVKKSEKYRNVICHGDAYVSNMLFKFGDQGECQEIKLIDFQILRYCPPTQDLLFFLFQSSLKETLNSHFTDLIDEYYNSLSNHLGKHNIDINDIYPRNVFDDCIEYMKSQAVMHVIIYAPFHTLNPEIREKIGRSQEEIDRIKGDPLYLVRKGLEDKYYTEVMKGVTELFVELNV